MRDSNEKALDEIAVALHDLHLQRITPDRAMLIVRHAVLRAGLPDPSVDTVPYLPRPPQLPEGWSYVRLIGDTVVAKPSPGGARLLVSFADEGGAHLARITFEVDSRPTAIGTVRWDSEQSQLWASLAPRDGTETPDLNSYLATIPDWQAQSLLRDLVAIAKTVWVSK